MFAFDLARVHGAFNVASGLWPLVHRRSFEATLGPKADYWLAETVAGLMVANGVAQLVSPRSDDGRAVARSVGVGTAGALLLIDIIYVTRGRIGRMYLVDAAAELGWIAAWTGRSSR